MQPQKNVGPRDQNKVPSHGLSADETFSIMEALDHIHVTRQYQGMGCCAVCRKISLKNCSGCKTFYCSIECQTINWPKHRLICANHRDNLSDQSSTASTRRMRSSTIKSFKEEPYIINGRGSPFTALTNQLNKKSGTGINENRSIGNVKIANKQYQNRDAQVNSNKMGSVNGVKEQKKNNDRKKILSPKMSWGSKKPPSETKTAVNNKRNSTNNSNSIVNNYSNNSNNKRQALLEAIENTGENKTLINSRVGLSKKNMGKMEVIATYRESPERYWVMSVSNLRRYEEIQALLNKECKNYESAYPEVGLVCGCSFGDEWFRGEIVTMTPDLIVHFIDYGNVSNYDVKVFKKLPDHIRTLPGLAFQIEFDEGTPRQYKTEDLESLKFTVEETAKTSDGISRVKVVDGIYGATEKPLKLAKPPQRKKSDQSSVSEGGGKTFKYAMDTISANSSGMLFFIPAEGKTRYGSIVPDNNKEANDSIQKVLNIESPTSSPLKAHVGDYVLLTDKDGNEQRGRVALRLGSSYYVELIDCGNVIMTDTVHPLPDDLKGLIHLGVKVTVEEVVSQEQMKQMETCFFTVKGESVGGKWPCILRNEQQVIAHVLLEKPNSKYDWKPKLAFLKSGATVEISSISSPNSFFVRSVDGETEQKFLDMNMEMIQFLTKAKNLESPPSPGEMCCAKFRDDGCYYRAVVNSVEKGKLRVMFVDFGNQQDTDLEDIKPLPETLKNVPIFAVKVELKNVSPKPWNNMIKEYIGKLTSETVELTLTFEEAMHNGVILREKDSGVVVNDFIENNRDKLETSSGRSLSKKEIYLDDDMTYTKFPMGTTFTLAILYVNDDEFKAGQTFWATTADMENFNYVNGEMSSLISEHCESLSKPYEPTYRELCLAEFEGSWYRAICVAQAGDVFKVFFVDFGNCCEVKAASIRKMEKEFLKAPALAMNCSLKDRDRIKADPELTKEISEKLLERINTFIEGVKVIKFEEDTFLLEVPDIEAMLTR